MRRLTQFVRNILKNTATHDTALLYASNLIAAGISFAVSLIVARQLGPTEFGIIAAYNAIVFTIAGFTDFGLGTGLIKFTSPLLKTNPKKAYSYFRMVFYIEMLAGLIILAVGLGFSEQITKLLGNELPPEVAFLAIIAAAVTSSSAYVAASLAAHKRFKRNAILSTCISLLRLGAILGLLITSTLSLSSVLYAYAILSFVAAAVGFAVTPKDYLQPTNNREVMQAGKNLFKFSGWLTLTFIITSIMGRLDFFYLYKIQGATEAGVYAAAIQLSMIFTMLIGAVSTVLTPHVSERIQYKEQINLLKRLMPIVGGVALILLLSSLAFPFIINLLFGEKFAGAAGPLTILIIHLSINVLLIPITLMFIPLGKVRIGTYLSVVQLGIALVAYPVLIGHYGSMGAALTILLNTVFAAIAYPLILAYFFNKEKLNELKKIS